MHHITLEDLEKETDNLRKKIFLFETFQAEKDVKEKKVRGPLKDGKSVIKHLKKV